MNVFQLLLLCFLFAVGLHFGTTVARPFFGGIQVLVGLGCGIAAVLILGWPCYKILGFSPPPPRCPQCRCVPPVWDNAGITEDGVLFRCRCCGQVLSFYKDRARILDSENRTVGTLKLLWPKINGIWIRVRH